MRFRKNEIVNDFTSLCGSFLATMVLPILVAGGGIAGLAAAISLKRLGYEVVVYEKVRPPLLLAYLRSFCVQRYRRVSYEMLGQA